MTVEIAEVVKEYRINVSDLEESVHAVIVYYPDREPQLRYEWRISHHYRPTPQAGFYFPSVRSEATFKACEQLLMAYAKSFTADVQRTDFY